MDTVIDCLMDSWGALWLWVFATVQDIFILQLTQSWLLAWIISFSDCKYHSLNKYFIRSKPVVGREEEADAQCCVCWRFYRVYRTDRDYPWNVLESDKRSLLLQDLLLRSKKKSEGQFKSIKGGPIWTKKDVLQCWSHCVKINILTNPTLLSPKLQAELFMLQRGTLAKK